MTHPRTNQIPRVTPPVPTHRPRTTPLSRITLPPLTPAQTEALHAPHLQPYPRTVPAPAALRPPIPPALSPRRRLKRSRHAPAYFVALAVSIVVLMFVLFAQVIT